MYSVEDLMRKKLLCLCVPLCVCVCVCVWVGRGGGGLICAYTHGCTHVLVYALL